MTRRRKDEHAWDDAEFPDAHRHLGRKVKIF